MVLKPAGITYPEAEALVWLLPGWFESRLVGKSEDVGEGERERLGAGMVEEAERDRLVLAKIGV